MSEGRNNKLRVLELYSGIGGMHWALKDSGIPFEVVMAVDINTTANQIYRHNFPDTNLNSFGIEKLSLKKFRSLCPNMILMSPPCQPFSRVGKKGDCDDVRTKSFLHILQLLQQVDVKPDYILVENVKGFETSRTRQLLVDTLDACQYAYQEYLLTPLQFRIPNSRLRYYMIAKLKSLKPTLIQTPEILHSLPESERTSNCDKSTSQQLLSQSQRLSSPRTFDVDDTDNDTSFTPSSNPPSSYVNQECTNNAVHSQCARQETVESNCTDRLNPHPPEFSLRGEVVKEGDAMTFSSKRGIPCNDICSGMETSQGQLQKLLDAGRNMRFCEETDVLITKESRPLADYMEEFRDGDYDHLLVDDKSLRQFVVMDIVLPCLKKSTCFTKRYGHYIEGAGSLVQMSLSVEDTQAASNFKSEVVELKNKHQWGEEELSFIRKLKLRYFSPREVANLLCFPEEFAFPDSVSNIQKYRCLGNSLNVDVVARLIKSLTSDVM